MDRSTEALLVVLASIGMAGFGAAGWAYLQPRDDGGEIMLDRLLRTLRRLLSGEPLRAIVYGAAVVVWLVVYAANEAGVTRFGPTIGFEDALSQATIAAFALTEIGRRYVSSPATVRELLAELGQEAGA